MKDSYLLKKTAKTVSLYYQRYRTRKELASLDCRRLKDIGISRAEQTREIRKPFWKE